MSNKPLIVDLDSGGSIEHWKYSLRTLYKLGISAVVIEDKTGKKYTNNYFLAKQKDMRYAAARINKDFVPTEGGYEVTLSCDVFARGVFLSLQGNIDNFISDNYMDILPGETVTVKVTTELPSLQFAERLQVVSFSDAVEQ